MFIFFLLLNEKERKTGQVNSKAVLMEISHLINLTPKPQSDLNVKASSKCKIFEKIPINKLHFFSNFHIG